MENGGTSSQIYQALAGCWQINDTGAGKNAVTAYTAQSCVTMVFPPSPLSPKQKNVHYVLTQTELCNAELGKVPWEHTQHLGRMTEHYRDTAVSRVMVRVTPLLFGSRTGPKHQESNLSAAEDLCRLCNAFHPSNIHNFSFLRTTTPPNVSIYSLVIEPELLQTMDSQFLLNIAKEEQME